MSSKKTGNHKGLTEARKRANKKYNDKFAEVKIRMIPERKIFVQEHAAAMNESTTAFINRAINETIERDIKKAEGKNLPDVDT